MELLEKVHPTVGVLVRSNGEVFIPATSNSKAHWTFGSNSRGYRYVTVNGVQYAVHRLVAETFIGPIPEGCQIDHISRDKSANMLSNLRIVTPSQNSRNTPLNDHVDARSGTHYYEDKRAYYRERGGRYREFHKCVLFSDGKKRWVSIDKAVLLLAIPLNQRIFKE